MCDDLVQALKDATLDAFAMISQDPVVAHEAREPDENAEGCMLYGYIGMVGDKSGYVCLRTPKDVAEKLASAMLGNPAQLSPNEIKDAVGEMVNMIAGGASCKLAQASADFQFEVTLPSIIEGCNLSLKPPSNSWRKHIPFGFKESGFIVEACVKGA
ncbi:MAG TPA: chemotaxis protein CheX [Candidatus Brocadiia bacterium]|nr:chemotaxis protein CheX [Candidatus Brocadiia bacterium]